MVLNLPALVQYGVERAFRAIRVVTVPDLELRLYQLRTRLERKIAMTAAAGESALYERLATRIGVLLAEQASLRDTIAQKDAALSAASEAITGLQGELDGERASQAEEVARLVNEALELDAQRDAARIEELLRQAGEEVPAPVPAVEVPAAGEAAEVPADAPGEVEPVDEGSLPATDVTGEPVVEPVPSDPAESAEDVASPGDTVDPGAAGEAGEAAAEAPADAPADAAPVEAGSDAAPAEGETGSTTA